MKTKVTVRTAEGSVITRTTARAYAFIVVARGERPDVIEGRRVRRHASCDQQIAEYGRVLATGIVPAEYRRSSSLADYATYLAHVTEEKAGLDSRAAEATAAANADLVAPFASNGTQWRRNSRSLTR